MFVYSGADLVGVGGLCVTLFINGQINRKQRKKESKKQNDLDTERAVDFALVRQTVMDMSYKFDKETGGNSGGLREAINDLKKDVEEIKDNQKGVMQTQTNTQVKLEGVSVLLNDHKKWHEGNL